MYIWVALRENVRLARIWWKFTEVCSNRGFPPELWKNTRNKNHRETWCRDDIFMVLWHGRSCKEMRGKKLGTCEWNNWAIIHSRNAMHGWSSTQRRRKWISWRIDHNLLTHCSAMSIFGTYWWNWYFMVCEQTCWQTFGSFDLSHSSHL